MTPWGPYADAPPHAMSVGETMSLRGKTFQAARARIDKLLASAIDVTVTELGLEVQEAADAIKIDRLTKVHPDPKGARREAKTGEELLAKSGHTLGPAARAAWDRYGPTSEWYGIGRPDVIRWRWRDTLGAYDFLVAHPNVGVRAEVEFTFRLRLRSGELVAAPLPPSHIRAFFAEDDSRAYVNFVLPHLERSDAFLAEVDAISRAFTLKMSPSRFEVSRPTETGSRNYSRMR